MFVAPGLDDAKPGLHAVQASDEELWGARVMPRKWRLGRGSEMGPLPSQQQAPAVETAQQVPVLLAHGPVLFCGHAHMLS